MEPVKNEILYRVKRLTQVDSIAEVNDFLELGWIILSIKSFEYDDYYTLGWPRDEEPKSPERAPLEFHIADETPSGDEETE